VWIEAQSVPCFRDVRCVLGGRRRRARRSSPAHPRVLPSGGAATCYPTACCASSPSVSGGLFTKGGDARTRIKFGGTHRVDGLA